MAATIMNWISKAEPSSFGRRLKLQNLVRMALETVDNSRGVFNRGAGWIAHGFSYCLTCSIILAGPVFAQDYNPPRADPRSGTKLAQAQASPARLEQLLQQGERQAKAFRLTRPPGDNAYETFLEVLRLDPSNARALKGLRDIADRYVRLATRELNRGELGKAGRYATAGLRVAPHDRRLQKLQADIQAAAAPADRQTAQPSGQQSRVESLIATADEHIRAGRLNSPQGNNAYELYLQLYLLDPGNPAIQTGMAAIAEGFLERAEKLQSEGKLQESLSAADEGLAIVADQQALLALKQSVSLALQAQQANQVEYDRLLSVARDQLAAGALDQSRANLQRALDLVPDDGAASALLAEVEQQLQARDRTLAEEKALEQRLGELNQVAERRIAAGKLVAPEDDNAVLAYRQMLKLDRDNQAARAGLNRVAEMLRSAAEAKLRVGELEAAEHDAQSALTLKSDDQRLATLLARIETATLEREETRREQARREREGRALLVAAQGALEQRDLENAQRQIQEAETRLGDDPDLQALKRRLQAALEARDVAEQAKVEAQQDQQRRVSAAEQLLIKARELRGDGRFQEALLAVREGLELVPDHAALGTLEADLERQVAAENQKAEDITQLLAAAKQQTANGRIGSPPGDNAAASYQQVLELDSGNAAAQAGLAGLVLELVNQGRAALEAENPQEAERLAAEGRDIQPRHPALLALEREIAEEQQKTVAADQKRKAVDEIVKEAEALADRAQLEDSLAALDRGLSRYPQEQKLIDKKRQIAEELKGIAAREAEAERKRELVETALATAQSQVERGQLEAARETLRGALDAEPGETRVLAQLESIENRIRAQEEQAAELAARQRQVDELVKIARQMEREGDLEQSIAKVQEALTMLPNDTDIELYRRRLENQIAERQKDEGQQRQQQEEVTRLLAQAQRMLDTWRLVEDDGNDAYRAYQQVLVIDPDNQKALTGMDRITTYLLRLAQSRMEEGDLDESRSLVAKGLMVAPHNGELIAMRLQLAKRAPPQPDKVVDQSEDAEERQRRIARAETRLRSRMRSLQKLSGRLNQDRQTLAAGAQELLEERWSQDAR